MLPSSAHPERPEENPQGPGSDAPADGSDRADPVHPAEHAGSGDGAVEPVDWLGLPEPVREHIAELAAAALGKLPADDIPRQLRPVARFAPAKRAKVGGNALLTGLRDSSRFRTAVLEWLREHRHDALNPNVDDPVAAASAAVLLGESSATSRVRLVAKNAEETTLRAERDAALARCRRLEGELARAHDELEEAKQATESARKERETELDKLRNRLRQQGVTLREAKDAAAEARAALAEASEGRGEEIEALTARLERERQRAAAERARAEKAVAEAETARQSAREARDADEVRLSLLLETLGGAVDGLRRELSVGESRRRPADTVRGASSGKGTGDRVYDTAALDRLLTLPSVHVIVDGYNITKTGYPELTLAEQRNRLVGQLSALAARTGSEVTVVFDGAGVTSIPVAAPRGVRVLFSDPGVLADDVIRSLVNSEPSGRPLLVATSDQAVVASVRAQRAHAVPAAVFLTRLGRT
ncbi:RNA-binding protein [Prauserella marina]|uniref:YacP-like NYN domain-containing protein n=1 Tax=Prauserella marina TaxID=530584 RepID=A0A222VMD6_9PSEU|nr:NYN domain-containing protein [Prauserella marina]ASR34923.1 RNA-binding protein [Prauserella marina]PWV85368.1 YacP-like NYN domain-containing protein [Prauserella marina]SDC56463.1 YacP-like NYN domain-containing protein [Prauserella marina]